MPHPIRHPWLVLVLAAAMFACRPASDRCHDEREPDCAGVPGGDAVLDCLGVCGGEAVVDCLDVCEGTAELDCLGVCEGDAALDCLGVCDGAAELDCLGVCDGAAAVDCLGVCEGTAEVDCLGVCEGTAALDCLGVCEGTAVPDCLGVCEGTAVEDCGGGCGGVADYDCAGRCDGICPQDYYDLVDPSDPTTLRATLHELIDDHIIFPYSGATTDTWDVLALADADPNAPGNIIDVLRNSSLPVQFMGNTFYNRDHIWPRSMGLGEIDPANPATSDCHSLFLSDIGYNSTRGSRPFYECGPGCSWTELPTVANGGVGGSGSQEDSSWATSTDGASGSFDMWWDRRGDVARALMYMDVRYEGGAHAASGWPEPDLVLTDNRANYGAGAGVPPVDGHFGSLSVLLVWHDEDPPDDRERQHHDAVYQHQGNRNPFVDQPQWAACLYLSDC